jgi:hypothetical protein
MGMENLSALFWEFLSKGNGISLLVVVMTQQHPIVVLQVCQRVTAIFLVFLEPCFPKSSPKSSRKRSRFGPYCPYR